MLVRLGLSLSYGKTSLFCFSQEVKLFVDPRNVFFGRTRGNMR